jgi:hypothetical protein
MRGEMFSALMYFLQQIHADGKESEQTEQTFSLEVDPPRKLSATQKLAFKYFSKDPKEKQQVTSLLARYGITPAVLQAKAAQQNSDAVQMFEAMGARRGRDDVFAKRTQLVSHLGERRSRRECRGKMGGWSSPSPAEAGLVARPKRDGTLRSP